MSDLCSCGHTSAWHIGVVAGRGPKHECVVAGCGCGNYQQGGVDDQVAVSS